MGEDSIEKMSGEQGEGEGSRNTLMKMSPRNPSSDDFELLFLIVKVFLIEL